ncbi:MAG: type II secretion system GspH family protein, partial [Patescibacteria group bacterium]|nr:type II secretion system GspH family protein [Patescibacteria group bacterium]
MKIIKRVDHASFFFHPKGFTLIELLVVIAVLGILATIVLLAVNPGEQLARGRDSSRVAGVTQLGRSLQAYYTANGSSYPVAGTNWLTTLTNSSDVKLIPSN